MKRIQRLVLTGLMVGLLSAVGGCASSGDGSKSTEKAAAPAKSVPPGSKLAKVEIGMSEQQVRVAIGEPSDIRGHITGKNWIPFYFGGDTYRQEWHYPGEGLVIFSNTNRWARNMKVIELRYNPDQA